MEKESRKQEEGRRRKGNKETKPAGRINHHTAEYCIYLKRNPNPTELDYFHFSRFPDLTATECRGARSTCGRVSGLGFFPWFQIWLLRNKRTARLIIFRFVFSIDRSMYIIHFGGLNAQSFGATPISFNVGYWYRWVTMDMGHSPDNGAACRWGFCL